MIQAMTTLPAGMEPGPGPAVRGERRKSGSRRFAHNLGRELEFLVWIRRNPLKSPDSDE
jgi:hypothetical protein